MNFKSNMICVNQLAKRIKEKMILQDIHFTLQAGECVALIGPNGAGKTTLMDCLLGLRFATSGTVTIDGKQPNDITLKAMIGYLPQQNELPDKLTVRELVRCYQAMYEDTLSDSDIETWCPLIKERPNELVRRLSGGQKRLLAFVLRLIGKPRILFLDEPTVAMDTATRLKFWEIIRQLKSQGVLIVYSSHYIEEVEHTAERILVLHEGQLIHDMTPHALRALNKQKWFTLPLHYRSIVEQWVSPDNLVMTSDTVQWCSIDPEGQWAVLQQAGATFAELELTNRTLLDTIFRQEEER